MVKTELIQRIAQQNPKLSKEDCRRLIEAFYNTMIEQLSRGEAIELRGFGSFAIKRYDERVVRNPLTGKITSKQDIVGIRFRTSKSLSAQLNPTWR